jgi:hypothetical protein
VRRRHQSAHDAFRDVAEFSLDSRVTHGLETGCNTSYTAINHHFEEIGKVSAVRGSLDVVSTQGALGWAFSAENREKLTVQALLNHTIVGEAIADLHRPDLAAVGLGDGNCGYHITFYQEIDPLYLPFVVVKLEGGDVDLPRSTISGYSDFFTALYKQYPVTGRHRSVFGGLWTDRIDAAALLRSRMEVGIVTPEAGAVIAGFLQDGFAIVEIGVPPAAAKPPSGTKRSGNASGTSARGKTPDLTEAICTILQSKSVLQLLHPILEGPPLAISTSIVEGTDEGFRQPSAMEALPSPAECLSLVVPLDDQPVELDVIRGSHQFPEFSPEGQSRWVNSSAAVAIDMALRQHGMIDCYPLPPGSIAIIGPGLIHRVRTEPGTGALRVHCTPSRVAPLNRMLDGSRKEITLETGGRIWV